MIVVTGATGKLGRAIVRRLIERGAVVGASVRDPAKAADLTTAGVRVRRGDFADPAGLPHAFEGADRLLIVSSNARATGGDPLAQHRAAIDAARATTRNGATRDGGIRRIVYTSHMAASASSAFSPMRDHAATEDMLRASGLPWTALRNGFYASSGLDLMGDALVSGTGGTGTIAAPADGPVAWTAHADLAEAAAILLTTDASDGPTPPLTGPRALDLADLARIASDSGRPVRRSTIADDDMRATLVARGVPAPAIDVMLGFYVASRAGEFAAVDPTLERMLGRRPTDMRELIAAKIAG